jgi:hypothetical protein
LVWVAETAFFAAFGFLTAAKLVTGETGVLSMVTRSLTTWSIGPRLPDESTTTPGKSSSLTLPAEQPLAVTR